MGKKLREGFTTGTCAAAAAKAAVFMLLKQDKMKKVTITLPIGKKVDFFVYGTKFSKKEASCYVIKDAGDDPDITNGIEIWARAFLREIKGVEIKGGTGVGVVTKPGLPVQVGESAINPVPRKMILNEILEVLNNSEVGLEVEISIPDGAVLAQKTLNPHLGIEGGLSILGTTGVVKPMSEEAYKKSLVPQLKITSALGYNTVVLTPGNIGHKSAQNYGVPNDVICQTSNFIGYMLEKSVKIGFTRIILWGHPGKLLKVACGNFHTHNRTSDGRMETLAAHLAVLSAPRSLIKAVLECNTTDSAINLIDRNNFVNIWNIICKKISVRAERYLFNQVQIGTVLLKDRYKILAYDDKVKKWGEELDWLVLP